MIPALLAALSYAPQVLSFGRDLYNTFADDDKKLPHTATADDVSRAIDTNLPAEQAAAVRSQVIDYQARCQELDTQRFVAMTDGDAEKIRASARPEIARRAMGVIEKIVLVFMVVFFATVFEWLVRAGYALAGQTLPDIDGIWTLFAAAAPVTDLIWPLVVSAIGASVAVITKYMGCRERDKAQQFELQAGRPLAAAGAVAEAAGGLAGVIVKAIRGR